MRLQSHCRPLATSFSKSKFSFLLVKNTIDQVNKQLFIAAHNKTCMWQERLCKNKNSKNLEEDGIRS